MKLYKHIKSVIEKIAILLAITIFLIAALWHCGNNTIVLHAVYPHVNGLKQNDPVLIENVPVGHVNNIQFDEINSEKLIVSMEVSRDYNIPDKSVAEIIAIDQTTKKKAVNISLVASIQYLNDGDTILTFTNLTLIDSLIMISKNASQMIKDSLQGRNRNNKTSDENLLNYKVQIFITKSPLPKNDPAFKGLSETEFYVENDYYKYVAGSFEHLNEAKAYCNNLKNRGFKDAFVVVFRNGNRISIEEADEILKK